MHAGASKLAAEDSKGALTVDLEERDGVQVASVRPRARVRYNKSVTFTLAYRLLDGSAPDVHVRSEVVRFAAWGFGTSSDVTVELPRNYEARADGDPMLIDTGGPELRLTSGPIPDPGAWLALITASQPSEYATALGKRRPGEWNRRPAGARLDRRRRVGRADARDADCRAAAASRRRPGCRIRASGRWW